MARPSGIQPITRSKHIRLMVFGDNGVGKTRLAATSPGRVLLLRPPTERMESIDAADAGRVQQWVLRDHDDLQEALDYLRADGNQWDWVWLDNISIWQDHGLDDLWETVIAEKPSRARYGLDKAEYNINMTRIARWVRYVVGPDLFNFGVTAHAEMLRTSPDPEAPVRLMPWVQGRQMSQKVCGYMNMVAFYEIAALEQRGGGEAERRVLRTNKTDRYWALDGFDALGDGGGRLLDPTMPKLIKAIEASRKPTTTARRRPARPTRKLIKAKGR